MKKKKSENNPLIVFCSNKKMLNIPYFHIPTCEDILLLSVLYNYKWSILGVDRTKDFKTSPCVVWRCVGHIGLWSIWKLWKMPITVLV